MKKNIGMILILLTVVISMNGCGKSKLSKDDDPQEVLETATKLFAKRSVRGSEKQKIYYYTDDTEEYENSEILFDTEKGIRQEKIVYELGFSYITFNVKEKNEYYVYIQNGDEEDSWIRYKEEAETEDTNYEQLKQGIDFSYTTEEGYSNVKYSNEGKEKLGQTETIKIKITAEMQLDSSEQSEEMSREDVMEEYQWSEEEVALVDGFSEILDDYVEACNENNRQENIQYQQYVWVDRNTREIVQIQKKTIYMDEKTEDSIKEQEKINTFENNSWKVDMVHNDLEAGISKEEILNMLQEAIDMLENNEEYEGEVENISYLKKEVETEVFLSEEEFPDWYELPEYYEELSEEEYYEILY